jgi:hypothetical protein
VGRSFDSFLCEPGRSKHAQQPHSRFVFVRVGGIVAPRCGESESSPFTKVAASRAGQAKGGVPCQAAATPRGTAPFMSVNTAPPL